MRNDGSHTSAKHDVGGRFFESHAQAHHCRPCITIAIDLDSFSGQRGELWMVRKVFAVLCYQDKFYTLLVDQGHPWI